MRTIDAQDPMYICTRCGKPIEETSFVGDGDGAGQRFAHYYCYYPERKEQAHPVALKPGKVLVEAEWNGLIDKDGDCVMSTTLKDGDRNPTYADPATVHPASLLDDLRAEVERLTTANNIKTGQLWQARASGDAARRELAEAVAWMREDKRIYSSSWNENAFCNKERRKHCQRGNAILARHAQPEREERRKGERRGLFCDLRIGSEMKRRSLGSDRRQQPAPVEDKQRGLYNKYTVTRTDGSSDPGGKHHKCRYFVLDLNHDKFSAPALYAYACACEDEYPKLAEDLKTEVEDNSFVDWQARATAAEAECERLREALNFSANGTEAAENEAKKYWELLCDSAEALGLLVPETAPYLPGHCKAIVQRHTDQLAAANARAEAALAKLATIANAWLEEPHARLPLIVGQVLGLDSPAPEKREEWPYVAISGDGARWALAVQHRIEALEASYSGVHGRIQGWQQGFAEMVNMRLDAIEKRMEKMEVSHED